MSDMLNNKENEEVHSNDPNREQRGAALIFLCMVSIGIALLLLCFALILNTGREDTPTEAATVGMTESIPEPTVSVPETEETIHIEPTETVPEVTESPVIEETVPIVNRDDVELLARVIYQEAGADFVCDDCRRRVADVVLNRVESEYFPDTIEDVLTQKSQYGRFHWTGVVWPARASHETEKHAVERAYRIAEEVLSGQHSDLYGKGYIWQAEFPQGKNNIYCCGIYFGQIKPWEE